MATKLSAKQAVVAVLTKHDGGPMKTSEPIAEALKLATGLRGNAKQTMYSAIYSDAKRENGVLVKTAPGMIALRDKPKAKPARKAAAGRRHQGHRRRHDERAELPGRVGGQAQRVGRWLDARRGRGGHRGRGNREGDQGVA